MRIQHNIMAMNAYRNYTNNTSAMQKNLERLSSGYKINRAGDDAAGLAISEKMRAQITGLQVASKNAKDGISLVQTAEGALTEVHDMLNRMVELATQSANGTYAGDTDRTQLQKELDQLKSEINRIADSANFNGIALLDGSMDTTAINGVEYNYVSDSKMKAIFGDGNWDTDDFWKGSTQPSITGSSAQFGVKAKLETEAGKSSTGGFQISLDGIGQVTLGKNETFKLVVGNASDGYTLEFTNTADTEQTYTAAQLVQNLIENKKDSEGWGTDGTFTGFKLKDAEGNERFFDVTAGADGKTLVFTAVDDQKDFKLTDSANVTWGIDDGTTFKEGGVDPVSFGPEWIYSTPMKTSTTTGPDITSDIKKTQTAAASGEQVKGAFETATAVKASVAGITANATIGAILNHLASIASATFAIGSLTGLSLGSLGLASTATAVASAMGLGSVGEITIANFTEYINGLINDKLGSEGLKVEGSGTIYGNAAISFASGGFEVNFEKSVCTIASEPQATIITVDFAKLTGSTADGAMITIGSVTYEFIASGASPSGNADVSITISKDATASEVAQALLAHLTDNPALASTGGASLQGTVLTLTGVAGSNASCDFDVTFTPATIVTNDPTVENTISSTGALIGVVFSDIFTSGTIATLAADGLSAIYANGTVTASMGAALETLFAQNTVWITATDGEGSNVVNFSLESIIHDLNDAHPNGWTAADLGNAIKDEVTKQLKTAGLDDTLGVMWVGLDANGNKKIYEDAETDWAANIPTGVDGIFIKIGQKSTDNGGSGGGGSTINLALQNVTDNNSGEAAGLANVVVNFGVDGVNAWQDGAKITIGDTTYTVAIGEKSKFKNVTNVIDLTDLKGTEDNLSEIAAQRLTAAAKDNSIFTVGHDGKGNTTLQQRTEVKETTDMSTKERLASYLGVSIADADSIESAKAGEALTLQIGDTAESYNQLRVSISDCHTTSLGLDGIDISTQEGAEAAIDKIKDAINYVSDVRGTLGATQNRLDHTINNISVMTENIQDAESTIRDTDIAEEMMAYTKNNILIQAAQAMLAQANQVPQGVLQLLQ